VHQRIVDPRLNFRQFCDWLKLVKWYDCWFMIGWYRRLYFSPGVNYCLMLCNSQYFDCRINWYLDYDRLLRDIQNDTPTFKFYFYTLLTVISRTLLLLIAISKFLRNFTPNLKCKVQTVKKVDTSKWRGDQKSKPVVSTRPFKPTEFVYKSNLKY
jgi:hypothetical protein